MQFKTIALASFLGLAAAASDSDVSSLAAQLPSCSTSCLDDAASSQGCDSTDYTCLCENMDAISKNATSCLTSSCSISNITATQSTLSEICDSLGIESTSTSNSSASATGTSSSSSSSSSSTAGSSAGSRSDVYGLSWAVVAGVVGLMVL